MPRRALSICRKPGCSVLIATPGYCDKHLKTENKFQAQEAKKTPQSRKFYSSAAWTKTSLAHRKMQPLCQECFRKGILTPGQMVHHDPDLDTLMAEGLNPLDHKYLETLCNSCHMIHLRAKRL